MGGVTGGNPRPMTAAERAISTSVNEPRRATYSSARIVRGGSVNFRILKDVNGATIPNLIYIPGIIIVPSALSLYRVRLFAKSTRNRNDPMMYEWPFGADSRYTNDVTGFWYENLDPTNTNRIIGTIEVDAASINGASFDITILFNVRRRTLLL